jgi:hypothetical protein
MCPVTIYVCPVLLSHTKEVEGNLKVDVSSYEMQRHDIFQGVSYAKIRIQWDMWKK